MGSTYYSLHYHWICSTKDRRPFIRPHWRARFHEYIVGQEQHHRKRTFEEELKELLEKHSVKYDPKYLL